LLATAAAARKPFTAYQTVVSLLVAAAAAAAVGCPP
jgi:hypothetical protein